MKFLAIEKELVGANWSNKRHLLRKEAARVYELLLEALIREIYFNEYNRAVIILETANRGEAKDITDSLPLVKNKLITFELTELKPYTGLNRIFNCLNQKEP